jgi:hypothetical protein
MSFEELFAAEVASRQATEAQQAEVAAAAVFDGPALLALLRCVAFRVARATLSCTTTTHPYHTLLAVPGVCRKKYGRSYDVSLVQRRYLGKVFVALNVMWRYMVSACRWLWACRQTGATVG